MREARAMRVANSRALGSLCEVGEAAPHTVTKEGRVRTVETGLDRRQELIKLEVTKGVQHILCRHRRAPCLLGKIVGAARDAEP